MHPHRNLLILGINELVKGQHISFETQGKDDGHIFCAIADQPSVVLWSPLSADEDRVSVWWKYDHASHPQAHLPEGNTRETFSGSSPLAKPQHYKNFVGATVSGWIERRTGKFLQGRGRQWLFDLYLRRTDKDALAALPKAVPIGFKPEGKRFF